MGGEVSTALELSQVTMEYIIDGQLKLDSHVNECL